MRNPCSSAPLKTSNGPPQVQCCRGGAPHGFVGRSILVGSLPGSCLEDSGRTSKPFSRTRFLIPEYLTCPGTFGITPAQVPRSSHESGPPGVLRHREVGARFRGPPHLGGPKLGVPQCSERPSRTLLRARFLGPEFLVAPK